MRRRGPVGGGNPGSVPGLLPPLLGSSPRATEEAWLEAGRGGAMGVVMGTGCSTTIHGPAPGSKRNNTSRQAVDDERGQDLASGGKRWP